MRVSIHVVLKNNLLKTEEWTTRHYSQFCTTQCFQNCYKLAWPKELQREYKWQIIQVKLNQHYTFTACYEKNIPLYRLLFPFNAVWVLYVLLFGQRIVANTVYQNTHFVFRLFSTNSPQSTKHYLAGTNSSALPTHCKSTNLWLNICLTPTKTFCTASPLPLLHLEWCMHQPVADNMAGVWRLTEMFWIIVWHVVMPFLDEASDWSLP